MSKILCLAVIYLILHIVHSYILLTANMEDVNSIAKHLETSPVVDQIKKIWHRAATEFNNELNKHHAEEDDYEKGHLDKSAEENRRRNIETLLSLSKNASEYIQSLKRAFDSLLS